MVKCKSYSWAVGQIPRCTERISCIGSEAVQLVLAHVKQGLEAVGKETSSPTSDAQDTNDSCHQTHACCASSQVCHCQQHTMCVHKLYLVYPSYHPAVHKHITKTE